MVFLTSRLVIRRAIRASVLSLVALTAAMAQDLPGWLYTSSNASAGNEVIALTRSIDGSLHRVATVSTGGTGLGQGLGSQGAVAINSDQSKLVVVNAGSNEVSSFNLVRGVPIFVSKVSSGGTQPISVAIWGDAVFVLNAAGTANIAGFRLGVDGTLSPEAGWVKTLHAQGPAQVGFDPSGETVIVTGKASNSFDLFAFNGTTLSDPVSRPSNGQTPFGFYFDRRGHLVVAEAFGGAAGAGAVSSYDLEGNQLQSITASLPIKQTADCWVIVTRNGRFAYTANTPAATITGLSIARDGSLSLLNANGVSATPGTGAGPIDLALSPLSRFLYSLNPGNGTITGFAIGNDGALTAAGTVTGLPTTMTGIAAR